MKFRMRFWSNNHIDLIDTNGGNDFQIFDASDDSLLKQGEGFVPRNIPLPTPAVTIPEERAPPPLPGVAASAVQNVITKHTGQPACAGVLGADIAVLGKGSWKVGECVPDSWQHGYDFEMSPNNSFSAGEMCAVMRPDRSVRFAKVDKDNGNNTYDLCTGATTAGLMHKTGVPPQFIAKMPHQRGHFGGVFPTALVNQVGLLFDLIDTDGSGSLDFHFDGSLQGELASDLGKRFLIECQVDPEDMDATYRAMKELDRNGDGIVERHEVLFRVCC